MKKAKKLLRDSFQYAPQVLVLFSVLISNVFFPALAIAQEITDLVEGNNEVVVDIPLDESEDILEDGITTNIYDEEEAVEPLFVYEDGVYTLDTVVEGEEYVYPENDDVRIRFSRVSEDGNLVIKRVVLTEEEKSSLNTTDDYGWDITSSMSNGSFTYDLTLPNTQGNDVEVKYTEDGDTYEDVEDVEVGTGIVELKGLEHFTVFVVVNPLPDGVNNGEESNDLDCSTVSIGGTYTCYDTIQAAVTNANENEEIIVRKGTYKENIIVNKSGLTIKSSNGAKKTIIDGSLNTTEPIFKITSDDVTIEGFTIKNAGVDYGAVYVNSAVGTKILKNIFSDNEGDLYIEDGSSTIFRKNTLVGENTSTDAWAIWISNSDNNIVKKNDISKKYSKYSEIYLENSNNNVISTNILNENNKGSSDNSFYSAIYLSGSSNNEILGNTLTNNQNPGGISLNSSSDGNTISDNIITNNNDKESTITPGIIYGSGIKLTSSMNNKITGNTINGQNSGIRLEGGSKTVIEKNILTENYNGINLYNANGFKCENNSIRYNEIYNNSYRGIYFQGMPGQYQNYSTTIEYNNIYDNVKSVYYDGSDPLNATLNWWGHYSGPSDITSGDITYKEWLCAPYSANSTSWITDDGICKLNAPTQTGYNVNNGDPFSTPRPTNEIACTGGFTNINGVSAHWEDVSEGNTSIKYQRQYSLNGTDWIGNEIYTNPYTNYRSFGGDTDGKYYSQVRAFGDVNGDGIYDDGEPVSEWSNECSITYDKISPTTPKPENLHYEINRTPLSCGNYTTSYDVVAQWGDDSYDTNGVHHYEYQSFNPTTGWIWPNESYGESVPTSQRAGAFTVGEGTYGFRVRAVDEAGNKSEWTSLDFENSCLITYDKTPPATPTGLHRKNAQGQRFNCGDVAFRQSVTPDWDDITNDPTFSHFEYSSFNLGGVQGLNEIPLYDSEFVNTWLAPTDGTYGFAVRSVDKAGNRSAWAMSDETLEGSCQITYDSIAPTTIFTGNNLTNTFHNNPILIQGTTTDLNGVSEVNLFYRVHGTSTWNELDTIENTYNLSPFIWEYTWTPAQGTYDIKASGIDIVGNTENSPEMTNITYDTTLPTISDFNITRDYFGQYVNGFIGFTLSAKVKDSLSGINTSTCKYTLDNSTWATASFSNLLKRCYFTVPSSQLFDNQDLKIGISIEDNATNKQTSSIYERTVDAQYAQSEATLPQAYYGPNMLPEIKGTAEDTVSGIKDINIVLKNSYSKYWLYSNYWTYLPVPHNTNLEQVGNVYNWTLPMPYPSMDNGVTYTVTPYAKDYVHLPYEQGTSDSFIWDSQNPYDPNYISSTSHTINQPSQTQQIVINFSGAYDDLSGVKGYYYSFSNSPETPDTTNWLPESTTTVTSPILDDGNWYFNIRTIDNVDNMTSTAHSGMYIVDTTPATISWITPTDETTLKSPVVLSASTNETMNNFRFKWQLDGGSWDSGYNNNTKDTAYSYSFSPTVDGVYHLRAQGRDLALNWSKDTDITVTIDNTAPVSEFTNGTELENIYTNQPIEIEGQSTDVLSIVDYVTLSYRDSAATPADPWLPITTLNNSLNDKPFIWSHSWTPDNEGTYDIKASATDQVGNAENSPTIDAVTYDTTPPTVTIDLIAGLLNITAEDILSDVQKVKIKVSDGEWIIYIPGMNINNLVGNIPGTYTLFVKATDKAGNIKTSDTQFTIPPIPVADTEDTGTVAGVQDKKSKTKPKSVVYATSLGTGGGSDTTPEEEIEENEQEEEKEVLGEETMTCDNPVKLTSHLYLDKNKNETFDENEKGIAGVTIRVYYILNGKEKTVKEVKTDEKGYWEANLCPGEYTVEINQEDLPKNVTTDKEITLKIPEDSDEVELNISALDTRNFWQKNWYIILIIGTLLLVATYQIATRKKEEQYTA